MYIQFAELPVEDPDRAIAFYAEAFGCTIAADTEVDDKGTRWIELSLPGAQTRLHFAERRDHAADLPLMVLVADDVPATVARMRQRGVTIATEPHCPEWEPDRIVAEILDSEGNRLMLSSPEARS